MNQMKISTRLTLAFTALVLLLFVVSGISQWRSAVQADELVDVVETRIPITKALAKLDDQVSIQAIQVRNLAIFNTEAITKSALDQITATRAEADAQYKVLDALVTSDDGKEILSRMQQRRLILQKSGCSI